MDFHDMLNRMMSDFFGFSHDRFFHDTEEDNARNEFGFFNRSPLFQMEKDFQNLFQNIDKPNVFFQPQDFTNNKPGFQSPRDQMLKRDDGKYQDTDLDGRLSAGDLMQIIEDQPSQPMSSSPFQIQPYFHGQSMSVKKIKQADGRIEEIQTIHDSQGNTRSTVTRQIGDKKYVHTSITTPSGSKEEEELFENLDEESLKEFNKRWVQAYPATLHSNPSPQSIIGKPDLKPKIESNESRSLWEKISKALGFES